ncbi:inorganic pyrophosphatase [Lysinibacillus parviboronicapiens]|uniref:Inorganic pyrophosphatase n=1 Tax=Lysinibacillus parviboronicapiens TaxID=436516 RepID=A0ABV2PIB2_9BACI
MKKPLKVGVLTSLLLTPAAIASAQEVAQQSQTQQVEQAAYINAVATTDTREKTIAQFGKLSETSSANDMVIAKGDAAVLSTTDFNAEEIKFITAKYNYIESQRALLEELKVIGKRISALSYTSKTFVAEVTNVQKDYTTFLGSGTSPDAGSYLHVQAIFENAVNTALASPDATGIVSSVRGTALQYGYNEAQRNDHFKKNGTDIAKLVKMNEDVTTASVTINNLEGFITVLENTASSSTQIAEAAAKVTTSFSTLTTDQKKIITAHNPNNAAVTPYKKYTEVLANLSAADQVVASITQLTTKKPEDFTSATSFIGAVTTIETVYNKLDADSKRLVTNYDALKPYQDAASISKQITALRISNDAAYRKAVKDARAALNNLVVDKKDFVRNIADLELAEENIAAAEVIEGLISGIATATDKLTQIEQARTAYNTPVAPEGKKIDAASVKKIVNNLSELTSWENSHKAVLNVIALVEKLDPAAKDYTKKAKTANTAYLKLDVTKREYVKNYKNLKDQVEAMNVVTQIMALNTSQKTYKDTVETLKLSFEGLSDEAKKLVTNSRDLETAKGYITTAKAFDDRVLALANEPDTTFVAKVAALTAEYKTMDKNAKKLVTQYKTLSTYEKNNANVVKVINLIAALNPSNKDYTKKVLAARKAYNTLDAASQKRVTNYAQLTAVEDVATLIGLIETLKPTSKTFLNDLKTARTNYDALPPEKQQAVINYDKLVTAETELTSAHTVISLIDAALPEDADYLTKLMNARVAYDKLSSGQKKLVVNIKTLTDREKQVKPILTVMVQIDGLEPGASNFVSKVNAARKAYDKLTKDQKSYVHNIATLQSYEPTAKVIELIGKLKSSSKTFHTDTTQARALYDALSKDMQQYVTNYHLLQAAETSILGAGNVQRMIDELSSIEPHQYVKRIEEIRAAYNALPRDQQMAVENYKTLQEQEKIIKPVISIVQEIDKLMTSKNMDSQYQKILNAYDKLSATQRRYVYNEQLLLSLDNVIKVYKSIAALKPSDKMYFGMVESVRRDYDSLSTTDKQRVSNYSILLDAEKNMSEVKKVVELIASLSPTSSTYIQDVANAVAAYKALDSKVRGQVLNYDALKKAEKDIAAVLKVVNAIAELDPDSKTFEKKVIAAQKLYSALTLEQQDLVYNYRILQDHINALGLN